jgi:long-chain fatty acid transport protein
MRPSFHSALLIPPLIAVAASSHAAGPAATGVVAQANDASSVFTSPAGMTRLTGNEMTLEGALVQGFSSFHVNRSETNVDGGDPDDSSDPIVIPSVYYVWDLGDRWRAGLALSVPTGFGSDYGGTWAGRYKTDNFSLVYISLTPALAYRVNDKLSLGMATGINYTSQVSEQKIVQPLKEGDGKLTSDLSGVGVSVTLSMLYEFSEHTRAGIAWTSDSKADIKGNIRLRNLGPVFDEVATRAGIKNINTKVTNTLPQRVLTGIYHEFDSGNYFTVDAFWMKFSDFSISNLSLNGEDVSLDTPKIYNDLWGGSAGMGFPADNGRTYRIGVMGLSQGVADKDRNFSIAIDKMWGVGAGVEFALSDDKELDVNTTLLNTGSSPVDSDSPLTGRVAGKSKHPYALVVDVTYSF